MDANSTHSLRLGKHLVTREPVRHSSSHLFVPLRVAGPEPSAWATEDHLVLLAEGYDEKLRWQESAGGPQQDGGWFRVTRYAWHGGDAVRIRYFNDGELVDEELVALGPPDPRAATTVMKGQRYIAATQDWFDADG